MKKSRDFGWTFVSYPLCVEGTDGTVVISILGGTHGYAVCCMSVECKKVDISHPGLYTRRDERLRHGKHTSRLRRPQTRHAGDVPVVLQSRHRDRYLQLVLALVSAVGIATRAHPLPPTATNPTLPLPARRRARPHLADSWQDGWSETSGSGLVQLVILVFGL